MIKEFDNKIKFVIGEFHKNINLLFNKAKDNSNIFKEYSFYKLIKHDINKKLLIGEEVEVLKSPYDDLRDLILGQTDFSKKQKDIVQFALSCTTEITDKYSDTEEYKYWLCCNVTGYKLLPKFICALASLYLEGGGYMEGIFKICKEQGQMSDDGDAWVDKYSGYKITNIDFDTDEGYSEQGFKSVSRDLRKDFGESIIQDNKLSSHKYQDHK